MHARFLGIEYMPTWGHTFAFSIQTKLEVCYIKLKKWLAIYPSLMLERYM